MILLDYIYYQLTNFYKYFEKDGTHKASGIILLCTCLCLLLTIILISSDFYGNTNLVPKNNYVMLIYYTPIYLLVCLRYWKFTSYRQIKEKVNNYSHTTKILLDIYLILFVLITFFCSIGFGIYVGFTKS